jgi:DNA-binding MltR family transcriptional regulator
MNNKTYFYRVAHKKYSWNGRYPMGPYAFFNANQFVLNNQKVPFSECTYKKFVEFVSKEIVEYKKFNINNFKLKWVPTLPNAWRPGPFEDIDLREKMILRMGAMTKNGKFHLYGFDSLMQALQWYNNQEELQFLEDNEFRMYKFKVKSKNMIVGKTQSVCFPDINDDMDMLWISSTKLSDLNKSININSTTQTINKFITKSDSVSNP